jgi:CO/xanthine dehydrogenase FAD-binding subunit
MKPFTYFAPADLSESVSMWNRYYDDAKLLAGGTDLIVLMKKGIFTPAYVIDLKRIRQLRIIERRNGRLMVGALATATEIAYSPEVRESLPGLAEAASCIGSEQIRNRATIGGNICRAAPSGDFAPILLAMDAKCVIAGPQGDRHLPVEELFISPGRNALGQGEILKELEITIPVTKWNAHYERFSYRDTLDMALTGAAVS